MNNRESENYAAVSKELGQFQHFDNKQVWIHPILSTEVKIEQCKLDIETAKEGLKEAKGVRKHREGMVSHVWIFSKSEVFTTEYDALASVILKMPSRQETIK